MFIPELTVDLCRIVLGTVEVSSRRYVEQTPLDLRNCKYYGSTNQLATSCCGFRNEKRHYISLWAYEKLGFVRV
jgi:hypothetical protein